MSINPDNINIKGQPYTKEIIITQMNMQEKVFQFAKNLPDKLLTPIESGTVSPENFRQAMKEIDGIIAEADNVKAAISKSCSEYFAVEYSPWAQGPFCAREREGEAKLPVEIPPCAVDSENTIASPLDKIASELCSYHMNKYKSICKVTDFEKAILEIHKSWVIEDLVPIYMDAVDDDNPDKPASREFRLAEVEEEIRNSLWFKSSRFRDLQQILTDAAMEWLDKPGVSKEHLDGAAVIIEQSLLGSTAETLDNVRENIVELLMGAIEDIVADLEKTEQE